MISSDVKDDLVKELLLKVYDDRRDLQNLFPDVRNTESDLIGLAEVVAGFLEFGDPQSDPSLAVLKPHLQSFKKLIGFPPPILATEMEHTLERHQIPSSISDHLPTLFMLTKEFRLRSVLELGVERGNSTVALLEAATKIDGHVWSIDVNPCLEAKELIRHSGLESKWTFIQGDDLTVPWKEAIDHLFIDTLHITKQASAELRKFEPFVREGGFITLHDSYSFPGVNRAVREYFRSEHAVYYEYRNNNGLLIVRKKS